MIQIKAVDFIPQLSYAKYSKREVLLGAASLGDIQRASEGIWVVTFDDIPVLVVGVIRSSLLSVPRLWLLVCSTLTDGKVSYNLRMIKKLMEVVPMYYPKLETLVENGWGVGERFAKFAGFKKTEQRTELFGREFKVWEF